MFFYTGLAKVSPEAVCPQSSPEELDRLPLGAHVGLDVADEILRCEEKAGRLEVDGLMGLFARSGGACTVEASVFGRPPLAP
jgi:hypothetical protein